MRDILRTAGGWLGGVTPATWGLSPSRGLLVSALALAAVGCGSKEETRTLEPVQLAMTDQMAPIYEQQDTSLYEVKLAVPFPIAAPTASELAALEAQPMDPYPHKPWLLKDDLKVQVTWTLSNIDSQNHNVELLVDPWNEFARYWPGMSVTNAQRQEQQPNLSGIDILYELPGLDDSRDSRRHGTITFEDMDELAIDFATAMNIIATAPPPDPSLDAQDNPAVGLVNHAFAVENRSYNDVVVQSYIPPVIAGLTGIDIGLRTYEPANVAIEIVVEVVDKDSGKVVKRDESLTLLPEPTEFITIANGG
jgi:hypothetical protein